MTIQVEVSAETEARLAAQAAEHSMDIRSYAACLLEEAVNLPSSASSSQAPRLRPAGKKSLPQLFAESPFHGLEIDFEREADFGRDITL